MLFASSLGATRRLAALGLLPLFLSTSLRSLLGLWASAGTVKNLLENAMRDMSTILCQAVTWEVLGTVLLRARLNRHPVVAGLPEPTDDLIPVAGGPS